jgi:hypothetical protein
MWQTSVTSQLIRDLLRRSPTVFVSSCSFFQLAFRSNIERIDDGNDDVYADDAMDVQPKPKSKAKPAAKPIQPKPITKTSQRQATVADQLDLASNKRSSSTRSIGTVGRDLWVT